MDYTKSAVGASDWLTLDYTPTDDASGFNFTDTASLTQATVGTNKH